MEELLLDPYRWGSRRRERYKWIGKYPAADPQLDALKRYIVEITKEGPINKTNTKYQSPKDGQRQLDLISYCEGHKEHQRQESSESVTQKKKTENVISIVPSYHIADQEQTSHPDFLDSADDFKTFLNVLSLIMIDKVKYLLMFLLDVPVGEAAESARDTSVFLNFLTTKGMISTTSIAPLTVRLESVRYDNDLLMVLSMKHWHCRDFLNAANSLFELFKNGKFCASLILKDDIEFERFLESLSFLMTNEVKGKVKTFFNISPANTDSNVNCDNTVFLNLMRKKGIISPMFIDPLVFALSDLFSVKNIVRDLFRLFQDGKIGASYNVTNVRDGDFTRFLNTLSLLMTEKVMKGLRSFFVIPDITSAGTTKQNNISVCYLLRERGIISPMYIRPLFGALCNISPETAYRAEKMFHLYEKGGFGSSLPHHKEKEGEFREFLSKLPLVITEEVKNGVAKIFDVPVTATDYDDFFACLREMGVISMVTIAPLCNALQEVDSCDTAESARKLFHLFEEGKFKASYSLKKDNDNFKRFLSTLSLLISKDVEEGLVARFHIPVTEKMEEKKDNEMAPCTLMTYMKEKSIVSSYYITPLTNALYKMGKTTVARSTRELFELFQEGAFGSSLAAEGDKDSFTRFLCTLSWLFSKDVKERLVARFQIPVSERMEGNEDNGMELCMLMKEMGIFSPRYITPLTNALYEMNKFNVARSSEELFELFKEGAFSSSLAEEGDKDNFRRFMCALSLLISEDVKERLLVRFQIPVTEGIDGDNDNGMALCTRMKEMGIISPCYITPLTNALYEMKKRNVASSTRELFTLFRKGTFDSSLAAGGDRDNFTRFLYTLSLLFSEDVKKGLVARFHLPVTKEMDGNKDNGDALCTLMKARGIISPHYITPLTNALCEMEKTNVARSSIHLFRLFKEGAFHSSLTAEGDKDEEDFERFLLNFLLLLTREVKEKLATRFDLPFSETTQNLDNSKEDVFRNSMKQKGVARSFCIIPLTLALEEMGEYRLADRAEENFKQFQKIARAGIKRKHENTQGSKQSIHNNVGKNDKKCQDSEKEEGQTTEDVASIQITSSKHAVQSMMHPAEENTQGNTQSINDNVDNNDVERDTETEEGKSPEDATSIQITFSKHAVQPMMQHAEDNTQGITQSIDENVGNNDKVQDLETVPLDIVKELKVDFRQHQRETAIDTDDSTDEDEELFSRAGGSKCLEATASISKEGGVIRIPNTEIELQIQPNSFLRDDEIHPITVKILPRRLFDEASSCFEDHSTVMVEILPNNLTLQSAAKLTLPHCLILRDPQNCDVQIFHSHHNPDQLPQWEDITTSVQHELSANNCHIWIENFSWIKYNVGGKEIEGKKLFVYTLGKRYTRNSKFVTAEVGYFPALPGNDKIKLEDADFITSSKGTRFESKLRKMFQGDWQTFVFWKEPKTSLQISVSEINPSDGWKSASNFPKYISYQQVEISNEQSRPFTFQRQKEEAPFPVIHFKLSQGEEYSEIYVDMEEGVIQDELQVSTDQLQIQDEKQQTKPMFEENGDYATTIGNKEVTITKAISPVNREAIKVRETALVVSSNNGGLVVRDELRKEITFQQHISPGCVQEVSNHLQEVPPISKMSPQLHINNPRIVKPISFELPQNDVISLALLLDTSDPLMKDWRMLAGNLGFTDVEVDNFARQNSPTQAVIRCACRYGLLQSQNQLIKILEDMKRIDAKNVILQ